MHVSQIQEHLPVNARNPGVSQGPCMVNIGTVERVEGNGYIKLIKNDDIDGRDHWFPADWIESVGEEMVCLDRCADQAMAELLDELPTDH
jgi:hypothetical protein